MPLGIEIEAGDWGVASIKDIHTLLVDVAEQLSRHLAKPLNCRLRIQCRPDQPAPRVLVRASPTDDFVIWLTVRGHYWAQFTYQFAHEFCHILADFERLWTSPKQQWFQESLCELASIFTLKQMEISWQTAPPYPNWREHAPYLGEYGDELLGRDDYQLAAGVTLGEWLTKHESALIANSCDRILNGIVAVQMYPIFYQEPAGWQAIGSMPNCDGNFAEFLLLWRNSCPDYESFVSKIAAIFGIPLS